MTWTTCVEVDAESVGAAADAAKTSVQASLETLTPPGDWRVQEPRPVLRVSRGSIMTEGGGRAATGAGGGALARRVLDAVVELAGPSGDADARLVRERIAQGDAVVHGRVDEVSDGLKRAGELCEPRNGRLRRVQP